MTRVSEFYQLDRTQPALDFVDVDTRDDIRVFLDPRAILLLQSDWGGQCRELLHTFFAAVLSAIAANDTVRVRSLLSRLREPNETHLGFSSGPSRGHGLGRQSGETIADALSGSRAAQTGLLQDLEDSVLLVPGIGHDIVSDITTNVLRGPLIAYTRQQAELHDIPTAEVASGPIWNPADVTWEEGFVDLPDPHNRKLLLVPKALVRLKMDFDKDEYYGDYLIPMLQDEELSKAGSDLVEMLKSGPRVTKKAIKEKYGTNKDAVAALTATHLEALDGYRRQKGDYVSPPLDHGLMAELTHSPPVDLPALLAAVHAVPPGMSHATAFHNAVEALLSALFYPALIDPEVEHQQHQGRKRVDIRYTNVARRGYFAWLIQHRIPAPVRRVQELHRRPSQPGARPARRPVQPATGAGRSAGLPDLPKQGAVPGALPRHHTGSPRLLPGTRRRRSRSTRRGRRSRTPERPLCARRLPAAQTAARRPHILTVSLWARQVDAQDASSTWRAGAQALET